MAPLKEKRQEATTSTSNVKEEDKITIIEAPSLRPRRSIVNYNENILFNTRKRFSTENSDSEDSTIIKVKIYYIFKEQYTINTVF